MIRTLSIEVTLIVGSENGEIFKFRREIEEWKIFFNGRIIIARMIIESSFLKNSHPRDLVGKCIREVLDKILAPKTILNTVPKKDFITSMPY